MAQTKNKSRFRKKLDNAFMNVFALAMTMLPIVTIGMWTHYQFFRDSREVMALQQVTKAEDPRLFEEPLVSVAFDDGWESVYSEAAPILGEYNIRSTQFVLPGTVDQYIYLSKDQIISLLRAGHEIGSHTMTHADITGLSESQLNMELGDSKKFLTDLGVPADMPFASPNGVRDASALNMVKHYYASHRNTRDISENFQEGLNTKGDFDRYDINALTIRRDTTDQQIKEALEAVKKQDAWIILAYHQVGNGDEVYGVSPDVLRRHMKMIRESGIKVVSIGDVVRTLDQEER